jgi:hypothetical protein
MKLDFNIRPAAEIPARDALRPVPAPEGAASPVAQGAPVSEISLLARRQSRLARRATR